MEKIPYSPGYRKRFVQQFFPSPRCSPPSAPQPKPEPFYAVVSVALCVYGVGRSRREALLEARKFINREIALADLPDYGKGAPSQPFGSLSVARCSEGFADRVRLRGGASCTPFAVDNDGVFVITEGQGSGAQERFDEAFKRLWVQINELEGEAHP